MKTFLTMSEDEMLNTVKSIVKEAFVRNIKTFSGGAKNAYNYGGGK